VFPTTLQKSNGGDCFGALGVGGAWEALSLGSFLLALPPVQMLAQQEWVPVEVLMELKQRQGL